MAIVSALDICPLLYRRQPTNSKGLANQANIPSSAPNHPIRSNVKPIVPSVGFEVWKGCKTRLTVKSA